MSNVYETIPRNTLVSDVAKELRSLITDGKIKAGEFLPPQKELAIQFGVGLSTIREAIQVLAAMGLVKSHPGKGTWVNEATPNMLINPTVVQNRLSELKARQVYEARSIIEVALTKFAAMRANSEDVQKIWDALRHMEKAGSDSEFVIADLDFHLAVASAGHNDLLEQFYHLTRTLLSQVITEMVALPLVREESILLQRTIVEMIQAHDVEGAILAAQNHMEYSERLLKIYA
jgi:GntR family transcriptional regulator, transcriptional repressor for pyruvate dehydrogenase complex